MPILVDSTPPPISSSTFPLREGGHGYSPVESRVNDLAGRAFASMFVSAAFFVAAIAFEASILFIPSFIFAIAAFRDLFSDSSVSDRAGLRPQVQLPRVPYSSPPSFTWTSETRGVTGGSVRRPPPVSFSTPVPSPVVVEDRAPVGTGGMTVDPARRRPPPVSFSTPVPSPVVVEDRAPVGTGAMTIDPARRRPPSVSFSTPVPSPVVLEDRAPVGTGAMTIDPAKKRRDARLNDSLQRAGVGNRSR